jgi:hypothetical protein
VAEAIPFIAAALGASSTTVVALQLGVAVYGGYSQRRRASRAAAAQRAAYNASLTDRMISMSGGEVPWQVVYGEATVAPAFVAVLTSGDRDQFKHLVCVWAAHACQAVVDVQLDGVSIGALDSNGYVTGGAWVRTDTRTAGESRTVSGGAFTLGHVPVAGTFAATEIPVTTDSEHLTAGSVTITGTAVSGIPGTWEGKTVRVTYDWLEHTPMVRARHHLGAADQLADAALLAEVPADWNASDRGRGLTYSVLTFNLEEAQFQAGPPQITATVRGARLYDPRLDSTRAGGSGTQRADQPATWTWSANTALAVADFLRSEAGKRAQIHQVMWDTVAAAATACDELLSDGTTTRPRYECHGSYKSDGDPDETLTQLAQAMAGFASFGGAWQVQAGSWAAPVMALTDADNAGAVELLPGPADEDLINAMRGRFYDPARFNQPTDFPPYRNASLATEDGATYWGELNLPFTPSAWRAHNLARTLVERSRGMRLVYPAKMRGVQLRPGQRVTLSCAPLSLSAATFRVVQRELERGGPVRLWLEQDEADYYDTVDAVSVAPPPAVDSPNPYRVDPVSNLVALTGAGHLVLDDDGSVISRVRLTYDASLDVLVRSSGSLHIEYRLDDDTDWTRAPDAPGTSSAQALQGLLLDRRYVIRVRWFNGIAVSDWRSVSIVAQGESATGMGPPGPAGPRVPTRIYLSGYNAWNSAAATAAMPGGAPIVGDAVVQYNNASLGSFPPPFAQERTWNGTAWVLPGTVLNGSVLVPGTVTAQHINVLTLAALSAVMGDLTSGTITGAVIRTAATGPRIVMDNTTNTLEGIGPGGIFTFLLDADIGTVSMDGNSSLATLSVGNAGSGSAANFLSGGTGPTVFAVNTGSGTAVQATAYGAGMGLRGSSGSGYGVFSDGRTFSAGQLVIGAGATTAAPIVVAAIPYPGPLPPAVNGGIAAHADHGFIISDGTGWYRIDAPYVPVNPSTGA